MSQLTHNHSWVHIYLVRYLFYKVYKINWTHSDEQQYRMKNPFGMGLILLVSWLRSSIETKQKHAQTSWECFVNFIVYDKYEWIQGGYGPKCVTVTQIKPYLLIDLTKSNYIFFNPFILLDSIYRSNPSIPPQLSFHRNADTEPQQ